MAEKKSRWYENVWVVTIGGGIATTTIGTLIYDKIKDKPILSTLWEWIVAVGHGILSFLNYELKVWWILLTIMCLILLLFAIAYFQKDSPDSTHPHTKPDYTNYIEDRFDKWTWRWHWKLKNDGWTIVNLTPYCERCDTPMQNYGSVYSPDVMCPRCKVKTYPMHIENTDDARVLILDNVRKRYQR